MTSTRWPAARPHLPGQQRRKDADGREQPGDDVADSDADLGGSAAIDVGVARDRHEPADRLDHEVVAGPIGRRPGGPVAADREMDELGVDGVERLVIEAEPREPAGPEVLDEHVGVLERPAQDRPAVVRAQVEAERALVAVDREEIGRGPSAGGRIPHPRRSPAAGRITLGRLDLDDVGTEVGEDHRAVRAGEDGREVDDADPAERAGRGCHIRRW